MQRPLLITVLAGVSILYGALGLFTVVTYLSQGVFNGQVAVVTLISILLLVFGFGAWGLRGWAWVAGVLGHGISIVATLLDMLTRPEGIGQAVVNLLLSVIIIVYLNTANVKQAFSRSSQT